MWYNEQSTKYQEGSATEDKFYKLKIKIKLEFPQYQTAIFFESKI